MKFVGIFENSNHLHHKLWTVSHHYWTFLFICFGGEVLLSHTHWYIEATLASKLREKKWEAFPMVLSVETMWY